MADPIPPTPGAPVPNKVQPKKETVRINLPPKPSAAPTIKLPTLPPGGPSAGVPGSMQAHGAPAPSAPVAKPPTHSGAAPAAPSSAQRPAPRPAAAPAAPTISGLDRILIMAAGIAAVLAALSTGYCISLFKD
jgi:hypothetical protein